MANELRVRQNFVGGIIEDNPLTAAATTLTSAALAVVPLINTTNHYPVTLDPDGIGGEPEIVWITAHTAGATTATILRAQEGTVAREHRRDLNWVHGPTAQDIPLVACNVYRPGTALTINSTSTSYADLDSTNMKWPAFIAPPSGAVLMEAKVWGAVGGSATTLALNIRTGAGDVAGTAMEMIYADVLAGSYLGFRVYFTARLTGLTPGTAYSDYRLGIARPVGTPASSVHVSPLHPAVFTVTGV